VKNCAFKMWFQSSFGFSWARFSKCLSHPKIDYAHMGPCARCSRDTTGYRKGSVIRADTLHTKDADACRRERRRSSGGSAAPCIVRRNWCQSAINLIKKMSIIRLRVLVGRSFCMIASRLLTNSVSTVFRFILR
jgi:hypothetical protein